MILIIIKRQYRGWEMMFLWCRWLLLDRSMNIHGRSRNVDKLGESLNMAACSNQCSGHENVDKFQHLLLQPWTPIDFSCLTSALSLPAQAFQFDCIDFCSFCNTAWKLCESFSLALLFGRCLLGEKYRQAVGSYYGCSVTSQNGAYICLTYLPWKP